MREWASDGSREAESASSRGADSSPFRSSAGCGSGSGGTLDESGAGFKYEVQTKFIAPGKLGFEFKEDDHGDGLVVVSKVHRNSTAAGMRNVCVGMVLVRVQAGRSSSEVAASELGFDGVMDLMSQRPLTLTFEHPWQKEVDDSNGRVYYYNSHTDKSDWTKPRELDEVVDAMREWASGGGDEHHHSPPQQWPPHRRDSGGLPAPTNSAAADDRFSGSEIARLPYVGARVEIFSQSSGQWEPGEVVEHIGRTRNHKSSDTDVKVLYKGGRSEKVVNALDASVFRLVEEQNDYRQTRRMDDYSCTVLTTVNKDRGGFSPGTYTVSRSQPFSSSKGSDTAFLHCFARLHW